MAESRIRSALSGRTLLTLGRLLAFIAVGFAVGLVIGVATEEPELLAGHLRGDTETIELDAALAAEAEAESENSAEGLAGGEALEAIEVPFEEEALDGLPDVAASPSDSGGQASGAVGRRPAQPAARAPSAISPASGEWAIQVGAFGDGPSAEKLADRLEGKGYPVEVLPAGADSNRWRVRVQPIEMEKSARSTAERIEREERLPTWVIRLEGQSPP